VSAASEIVAVANTAELRDALLEAAARAVPLRITAGEHWLDAGRPVCADHRLSVAALDGITEYTPGDLTLTARAGTSLAEIARVTATERQWLALDPFGPSTGSIGATIATGSAGPLAHAFGTPRDNVLGLEAVTGTGAVVRAGGRVVKNVAGFDLTRLFTGSWGTLGVITEVTVRLRALPEVDESYVMPVDDGVELVSALATRLSAAAIAPLALELVNGALASRLALGRAPCLLVRLGGNAESVRAQRAALEEVAPIAPSPAAVWSALRECEPARAAVIRLSMRPSRIAEAWSFARVATAAIEGALVHASIGRGVVRCIVPCDDAAELDPFLASVRTFAGTRIVARLPANRWPAPATSTAPRERLSRGIKDRFDPMHLLNPGIMGEHP
jgi:glycolate oxidase FAD binding subunit